jgi:hypothetical protein
MQASGNHQVKDQPYFFFKADTDSFAEASQLRNCPALDTGNWRRGGA